MVKSGTTILVISAIVVLLASNYTEATTLFDFEAAPYPGTSADIETYMEGVYGSDITVTNPIVGDGPFPGPLGPDHYIQVGPDCGVYEMIISFEQVPITAVEFDWGVEDNYFNAYADDDLFFNCEVAGWSSGHLDTYTFDSPVTTLKFTNSGTWEIEVDNLEVTPVPEPATIALLGMGGLFLLRRRKRK